MADVLLSSIVGGGEKTPAAVFGLIGSGELSNAMANLVTSVGLKKYSPGAMVANEYKNVLSVSGPGRLLFATAYRTTGDSQSVGLRIIIDGATFYDVLDLQDSIASRGVVGAGVISTSGISTSNYRFNTLSIDIRSSMTATNKMAYSFAYTLDQ